MRVSHLVRGCCWSWCLWLLLQATAAAQYEGAAAPPESLAAGFQAITPAESKAILSVLAGPQFGGRGTGQSGYYKAAHWVAGRLAEYGFEPIGEKGSYFQDVPITRSTADLEASFIQGPNGLEIRGAGELAFSSFGGPPSVTGNLIVVRLTEEQSFPDPDVSLEGKVVLLLGDLSRDAARELRRKRPAAVLEVVVGETRQQSRGSRTGSTRRFGGRQIDAVISKRSATKLLQASGIDPAALEPGFDPGCEALESDADITVTMRQVQEPAVVPNVVAWFPGSDPKLRHEYVTIGAHLDHLGVNGTKLFAGADDNGSGSTALIQVARAINENPIKPKRSVLVIAFAAEELGLVGSRFYCDNPLKPLEHMVCMFNMDMVGRDEETDDEAKEDNHDTIHLVGSQQLSQDLHDLVLRANQHVNFRFEYDQESVFRRSDQAAFAAKDIPVSFVFSGFNPHYHWTTDTVETINFHKIASAARLNYLSVMLAADHGHFAHNAKKEDDKAPADN